MRSVCRAGLLGATMRQARKGLGAVLLVAGVLASLLAIFPELHPPPVVSASGDTYVSEDAQYVRIGNEHLELAFQKSDGELYAIKHKATNVDLIDEKNAWWCLYDFVYFSGDQAKYVGGWIANSFSYILRTVTEGVALDLYWDGFNVDGSQLDVQVCVTIELEDSSQLSYGMISITNNEDITIEAVDFPAINGLGQISDNPDMDYLAYPSMSGVLFQNPLAHFKQDQGWGWDQMYPSGYSTMQFMAYYGLQPAAGLYLAAYDSTGNSKFLNAGKGDPSWLALAIRHIPQFAAGADVSIGYPIVIGVFSGDWYDAAQIYRSWAVGQPWTSKGTLAERSDIPGWYCSAGLRQWIYTHPDCLPDNPFRLVPEVVSDTATYFGHPVIANWIGWEHEGWYSEYPDVFPPKEGWDAFRQAVLATHLAGNQVLFVPDTTSCSSLATPWSSAQASACRDRSGNYPNPFSFSECGKTATFYRMCPGTSFWQDSLKSMLSTLAQEGADVIQLDGFPIFGPQQCVDPSHGHPLGGGTWWYDSYEKIFSQFKAIARQSNPDLVLTSEGMSEIYIPLFDGFWDPFTTGWSPNSALSSLDDQSKVQLIPLWHAVYHDYAFLESGICFVSRFGPSGAVGYGQYRDFYVRGFALSLVWGEMPVTWYADEKVSQLDEQAERDMAGYVRRIVEARTVYAQPYLALGRMLRLPRLDIPYFHINGAASIPYTLDAYPDFDSPTVLGSAWKAPSGDVGYIFTNISTEPVTFTLPISSVDTLLSPGESYTVIQNRNGCQSILEVDAQLPQTVNLEIEPLDVLLVRVTPTHTIARPTVQSSGAASVTSNSAMLRGDLVDLGTAWSASVSFEWGVDTNYGNETACRSMTAAGSSDDVIDGLTPGVTYHFRAKAVGDAVAYSNDTTFTTATAPDTTAPSIPNEEGQLPFWLWIPVAVGAVAMTVMGIVFWRRRARKST